MAKNKISPASAFLEGNPAEPIRFSRGVLFGKDQDLVFGGEPDQTGINPNDGTAANLWLIDPDESDKAPVVKVVVVDERCTRRDSFKKWLRHEISVPPENPPSARLFIPERTAGRRDAAQRVQIQLDEAGIETEVLSYHPPHAW